MKLTTANLLDLTALPWKSSAFRIYAAEKRPKAITRVRLIATKTIFVRKAQMVNMRQRKPMNRSQNATLALNPVVARPAMAGSPGGAYIAYAENAGFSVAAKAQTKPPKTVKETDVNVLPRTHSRMPLTNRSRPPWKK